MTRDEGQRDFQIHSVKFNAVMNTLLTASNMLASVITIPYVTRVLTVEGYGDVSFAQSVSSWLSALCLVGINVYGVRECANARDNPRELARVVRELLAIITISTTVVLGLFAVSILYVPQFRALAPLMWMFLLGTLLLSYGVEWFYQGIEQYSYITKRGMVCKLISLVATFLFVRNPDDYLVYGAILALVMCANNVLNLLRLHKLVDLRSPGKLNLRRHVRSLSAFGIQSVASAVYLSFDSTLLGMLSAGNYQVGLYQLATKLKGVMFQVLNAVLGVMIPRLSYHLASGDREAFRALLRRGFGISINVCCAIAGYLLVFSEPVVLLVSGRDFVEAAAPLRIIGLVNLASCMSYFFGLCILTPLGRERQLAFANLSGVPVSVVLNLLLDPTLGALGASVSILASELLILVIQGWCSRDVLREFVRVRDVAGPLVSNAVAVVASLLVTGALAGGGAYVALVGLAVYSAVDVACALVLRDETAWSLVSFARGFLCRSAR
ncbi:oligosaccharide flippase family protein [uncultured Parolsenella sp.]|uniref:flippase n=1 Tax=uncultured Parolsenella sp. TaxID=2083008 RepID=UPI0027D93C43|nr:oligosaccharide flippase family protein [uncultured Parolsenella sp.]